MGLFGKKTKSGLDAVSQYTKMVEDQISDARALLADVKEFDPRKSKHAKLVRTILVIAANIPETRMADARSSGWNEAKYKKFVVKCWSDSTAGGHSHAQGIYYDGALVIEWNAMADAPEEFRVVRLGSWCEELFDNVMALRHEVEAQAREDEENHARVAAEFQATRFKPLD